MKPCFLCLLFYFEKNVRELSRNFEFSYGECLGRPSEALHATPTAFIDPDFPRSRTHHGKRVNLCKGRRKTEKIIKPSQFKITQNIHQITQDTHLQSFSLKYQLTKLHLQLKNQYWHANSWQPSKYRPFN